MTENISKTNVRITLARKDVTRTQFSLISWPLPLLSIMASRSFIFSFLICPLPCLLLSPIFFLYRWCFFHPVLCFLSFLLSISLYVFFVSDRDNSDHKLTEYCLQLTTTFWNAICACNRRVYPVRHESYISSFSTIYAMYFGFHVRKCNQLERRARDESCKILF